ncbi:TIGR01906 family membrane protein [Streptococcus thoraltensis]|uniref:TIGR01906 family membrane protein n=1 Tax=Streptococcus thoraltensis TaxID=55085 RepID=UPI001F591A6E|nr:TIGR01906 family membrane protein [Streptococcus thoraltensis]
MKSILGQRFLALLSIIWLLALAILLTIYLAWLAYPLEIDWLNLLDVVKLSKSDLLRNYHHLLNYLTNPFHQVLAMPDFPSSKDGLKHFSDVKGLFHLAQLVFLITSLPTIYFLIKSWRNKSLFIFQNLYLTAAIFPIFVGLLGVAIGFNEFFTLFHQMLFPGDSSWLFNPYTDPIINVLPEPFFMHCFITFFVLYELLMSLFFVISRKTLKLRVSSS